MSPTAADPLSLHEVADRLGVHYMTAYRHVRTGALDATQEDGRWLVTPSALDAFRADRRRTGVGRGRRPAGAIRVTDSRRINRLTDRLLAGDPIGAWNVVESALAAGTAPTAAYTELLTPALRRIGERWETGATSIGEEHRATAVAMRVIGRLGAQSARPGRTRGTVVLAAAPADRHALPTAILADLLRARQLTVIDLGADTPPEELAEIAARERPADRGRHLRDDGTGSCPRTRPAPRGASPRGHAPGRVLLAGAAIASLDDATRLGADGWTADADDAVQWFSRLGKP